MIKSVRYPMMSHSSVTHNSLRSVSSTVGFSHLSVPIDHHLLCKAHFNWITPQTSSLLCRHDR